MKLFAFTLAALVAVSVSAGAFDVLHMQDRREVRGLILSETKDGIVFRIVTIGKKGEIAASAEATFPKSEIVRVERMDPVERRKLLARSGELGGRRMLIYEALKKIRISQATLLGKPALRTRTDHFEIVSTCDELFVREMTHYTEQMFAAYRRSFQVRKDATARVPIYLFASREEYEKFQRVKRGRVMKNPAYYSPAQNYIAAFSMVQKEKADKIRTEIKAIERKVREYKKNIEDSEEQMKLHVREQHKKIRAAYAKALHDIQRGNPAGRPNARRRLDAWKKAEHRSLSEWQKRRRAELRAGKKKMDDFISKNRRVIMHNNRILLAQNREMFELFFHEGFHAFAYNFLWLEGRRCHVPRWLNEGFACYFQESAVEAGYLIHGGVDKGQLALLRKARSSGKLLPLEKIVAGDARDFIVAAGRSGKHAGLYYAQSWAIVHYMLGRVPIDRVQDYLLLVNRGVDKTKAFEALMGKKLKLVEAEVLMHMTKLK